MSPEEKDPTYLRDMLEAARQVVDFTRGLSFEAYMSASMVRMAVERGLEILGEAARRVSPSLKEEHPEVPWRDVIGLRNVLSHDYGEVRQDRLWEIASRDVPALIGLLEAFVFPDSKQADAGND